MKSSETFLEVVELIRKGEDISQEELVDCCGYAQDGVNELYILLKAFRDGYKAQQETIRRKQVLLEAKIEEIKTKERTIWVLNQKIRKMGGEVPGVTAVNGRQIDGPTGDEDPAHAKRGEG